MRVISASGVGLLSALVCFGSVGPAYSSCEDPFGDPDGVVELHLRLTTTEWEALQTSPMSQPGPPLQDGGAGDPMAVDPRSASCDAQYPYFDVEFRCGEESDWLQVGVRRKRDRTESSNKLPIKLDFNHSVRGQRWPSARGELGYRKLTLNSGQPDQLVSDPERAPGVLSALLTERLAWRVMQQELPEVSSAVYATLTLHFVDTEQARFQGLYILIEDIDETAIESRYGAANGTVFKTTRPECRDEVQFEALTPNPTTQSYDEWLAADPGLFETDWEDHTEQIIELDGLLRQEALRELLANTDDTPLGRMNNYFAVDLVGRRRLFLPWDLDDMFRPEPQARPADTPLVTSCVGLPPCAPGPLGLHTRAHPEIRVRYLQTMCQLSNGVASETALIEQLEALDAQIRPLVEMEALVSWPDVSPLDVHTPGTYAAEFARMQDWIPARIAAVRGLIEAEGVSCAAGCSDGDEVACDYHGCPSRRVCSAGAWQPCASPAPDLSGRDWDCDGDAEFESLLPVTVSGEAEVVPLPSPSASASSPAAPAPPLPTAPAAPPTAALNQPTPSGPLTSASPPLAPAPTSVEEPMPPPTNSTMPSLGEAVQPVARTASCNCRVTGSPVGGARLPFGSANYAWQGTYFGLFMLVLRRRRRTGRRPEPALAGRHGGALRTVAAPWLFSRAVRFEPGSEECRDPTAASFRAMLPLPTEPR